MALPPTIPTSFVPHAPSKRRQFGSAIASALSVLGYVALAVAFLLAVGVFVYGRVLAGQKTSLDSQLNKAESSVDTTTVQSFIRLQHRLNAGTALLANHTAFSRFFTDLEQILPTDVRFSSVHLSFDNTGTPTVDGSGVAASFNALAAASQAFAADGRIKDVIFSKMSINPDNSVSFGFSATLDSSLVGFSASAAQAENPTPAAATTTSATSTTAL